MKSFLSWRSESENPQNGRNESKESIENSFPLNEAKNINESIFNNHQQDFREVLRNMFNPGQQRTPPIHTHDFSEPVPQQKELKQDSPIPPPVEQIKKKKIREEVYKNDTDEDQEEIINHPEEKEQIDPNLYKLYRDREETFECNVTVEGASLASSQARIIIDTADINLVFYGKIYKDGRCLVPLKKMKHLPEGAMGRIRLEVIVDDTLFVPWESSCKVEGAKKVKVEVKSKKSVRAQF